MKLSDALVKNKFMSKEKVLTEEAQFENTYQYLFRTNSS